MMTTMPSEQGRPHGEPLPQQATAAEPVPIDDSFRNKARELLSGGRRVTAGCIHLIGLADIREELGSRWEAVKDRVHDYTCRALQRVLSPNDLWFRLNDSDYVVVFAVLDKPAAQLVCGKIVANLHSALLGNSDLHRVTVRTAVLQIDGGVMVEKAHLDELLDRAVLAARGLEDGAEGGGVGGEATGDEPAVRRLSVARTKLPAPSVLFRPYFDTHKKVISTYACRPDAETARYLALRSAGGLDRERAAVAFDHEALASAVEIYVDLYANKFRYAQTIPVHFDTLAVQRNRRLYIEQCQAIPEHLRSFLAFELLDLPGGVPYGRLAELAALLRPFARAVMVQIADEAMDLHTCAQAGIRGAGLCFDPRVTDHQATDRMRLLCQSARKSGLFTYVEGVRNAVMLHAAEEAGVSYVAGPVIGPDAEFPEHMRRCSEAQLLKQNGSPLRKQP
ncbi:hypothetical protein [Azospirillum thermophilum]|uniref:GGDEF domain-containing protein n=1 Tax=Azospirillum thermophilum TaxID=2202148 RepID=A0A2S2CTD1_9PROT|nr:hypothetical protein [Azospirillum thermophilum]AWK87762.1 hypothetical protein DEW08_17550 [Azospirillum thermophilum]